MQNVNALFSPCFINLFKSIGYDFKDNVTAIPTVYFLPVLFNGMER